MTSTRTPLWGYLTALAISVSGTRLSMIAIPWFVLTSTGSATMTGLVAFAEMAPLVLLQFLSGPYIDRIGARRMALTCSAISAVVVGTIPLLHVLGLLTFPLLLVLVALAGAARGPGDAAGHAMLPLLVEHAHLPTERVTGLAGAVERTASLAGAAVAGGLVALVGGANALVVDAASFAIGGVVLALSTRGLAPATPAASRGGRRRGGHDVRRGAARRLVVHATRPGADGHRRDGRDHQPARPGLVGGAGAGLGPRQRVRRRAPSVCWRPRSAPRRSSVRSPPRPGRNDCRATGPTWSRSSLPGSRGS